MTAQFTPGPWASNGLSEVVTADYRQIIRAGTGVDYDEAVANARLIAAAPELYTNLDLICRAIRNRDFDGAIALERVSQKHLAKARGGA